MWTSADLKKKAWKCLAHNFGWALLLIFLCQTAQNMASSFLSGISGVSIPVFAIARTIIKLLGKSRDVSFHDVQDALIALIKVMTGSFIIISAVSIVLYGIYAVFMKGPLQCGVLNWFVVQREKSTKASFESVFEVFRSKKYMYIVKGMAWRYLWLCIWSTISFIPMLLPVGCSIVFGMHAENVISAVRDSFGMSPSTAWIFAGLLILLFYLIAALLSLMIWLNRYYSYFFVPFLLLNQPELGCRGTLSRSKLMAADQKSKICILDLSFIGWWILVAITCGLLAFVLRPYLYATYAELYFARKDELDRDTIKNESNHILMEGAANVDM